MDAIPKVAPNFLLVFFFASLLAAFSHIHTPYITREEQLKWD